MSKPIGDLTLKATPVGTDAVAIADSEDSNKTKKVLLSAIGGGASNVHNITNVTFSNPNYSGTASDVTQYEDGHLYTINFPTVSGTVSDTRYININGLGDKELDYNNQSSWTALSTAANLLPTDPETCILLYSNNKFYFISSSFNDYKNLLFFGSGAAENNLYIQKQPIRQVGSGSSSTTPSITINSTDNHHICYTYSNPLSSLTISGNFSSTNDSSRFETVIIFTTGATFTFTSSSLAGKWLGVAAPTFDPNTSYVIRIKNGYGIYYKVGA